MTKPKTNSEKYPNAPAHALPKERTPKGYDEHNDASSIEDEHDTEPVAIVDSDTGEVVTVKKKLKEIHGSHEFWKWDLKPVFEGVWTGNMAQAQSADSMKSIGYLFTCFADGETYIISNCSSIEKAISKLQDSGTELVDFQLQITFKGKMILAKGKPYNKFVIKQFVD